jgi:multidrug resistance efflux pump
MQPSTLTNETAMASIEDTIKALETKLKQAKAKKQQIEARKRSIEQKYKRREDTRRKILVGAVILAKVERGEWPELRLRDLLDKALTRTDDRALFDLPPVATKAAKALAITEKQQRKKLAGDSVAPKEKDTPPAAPKPTPAQRATTA